MAINVYRSGISHHAHLPTLDHKCLVCEEDNATKHYGSYCCSGCKGFFRRTARFQRVYICPFDNNCNITKEFRNACRACRYTKCLTIGMNPLLVHSDRGIIRTERKSKEQNSPPDLPITPEEDDYTPPCSSAVAAMEAKMQLKKMIKNKDGNNKRTLYTWRMPTHIRAADINLPLGRLNLIGRLSSEEADATWKYFATVEKIIDNYKETDMISHLCSSFQVEMNLSVAEVSESPRLICRRTKFDWSAERYPTAKVCTRVWGRTVMSYFDWASFIPELQELNSYDRNLVLISRFGSSVWMLYSHRSAVTNAPGILFSGGCYFPRKKEEWSKIEPEIVSMDSRVSDMINLEIIDEMRALDITDEEFAVLRVLNFFTAVPQLSKEGYEIVQNARRKYANILTELIRVKNASQPFTMIIERINRFMLLLPVFERVAQINDECLSMLVLFNIAEMNKSLAYELHVGKNATKRTPQYSSRV